MVIVKNHCVSVNYRRYVGCNSREAGLRSRIAANTVQSSGELRNPEERILSGYIIDSVTNFVCKWQLLIERNPLSKQNCKLVSGLSTFLLAWDDSGTPADKKELFRPYAEYGNAKMGDHYEEGKSYIDNYADIAVIHSTQGLKGEKATWCVQKGTWESIQKIVTGYRLRRYKTK